MTNVEDLFQEKLEQLEAGLPLEECLVDLQQDEAEALLLAASLRAAPYEAREAASLAQQRSAMLESAAKRSGQYAKVPAWRRNGKVRTLAARWLENSRDAVGRLRHNRFLPNTVAQLRDRIDRNLSSRKLTMGLAAVLVLALLVITVAGVRARLTNTVREVANPQSQEAVSGGVPTKSPTQTAETQIASAVVGEAEAPNASVAAGEPEAPVHEIYLPFFNKPLNLDPQKAALVNLRGLVEVQSEDGTWAVARKNDLVTRGQSVRTGSLSSVTLAFFDGGRAQLGPESEVTIIRLHARKPGDGSRRVILRQQVGASNHHVQTREDDGSRYEVRTPAGTAVAKGTAFNVLVTVDLLARFTVTEGALDVTALSRTVPVVAGQQTTVLAGRVPDQPVFHIEGEGEVTEIGAVWIIAGLAFETHERTIIIGNPQVGDLVRVEGHLLLDGTRVADRIILLRRALGNRFSLSGEVESIDEAAWRVAGQTIMIDDDTEIDEDIVVGDTVRVEGVILSGGTLLADQISRLEESPGFPFRFVGLVETIGTASWTISGRTVAIDENTELDRDIQVGDLADVKGWILEDGTWLATSILPFQDEQRAFSISGTVQSINPWQVADIPFEVRNWTVIEPGIGIGDLVQVKGIIAEDGSWIASTIDLLFELPEHDTLAFFGIVESIDPWVVGGILLPVDANTVIEGEISVGSLVWVEIELRPDGTWRVVSIRSLTDDFGAGCFIVNTDVESVSSSQIILNHLPIIDLDDDFEIEIEGDLDDDFEIEIEGDLDDGVIVVVHVCVLSDGTIVIVSIVVIHEPIIIILPPPPPPVPNGNDNHNHNSNHNG